MVGIVTTSGCRIGLLVEQFIARKSLYKFTEIETAVKNGEPVYLTKNGYGSMVVISLEIPPFC